eukprot:68077_1
MIQYKKEITVKVNNYINAKIVKATTAGGRKMCYREHYGIARDSPLAFNHLLSIVLYCDYSELSSDFSASFRKISRFETISSIKNRNSQYYWLSKYLRECVECYGQCSSEKSLFGPFYCGMNILMNIPQFNIRLCSPTSTSVHIEVAIKFSGRNGIILQFNNPRKQLQTSFLRGFNVSWISRFAEEDERLFFGGFYYMQIQSVRLRTTEQNFEDILYSISYLDICFTGGRTKHLKNVSNNDILVIETLFKHIVNKPITITLDKYIYDTFAAFVNNKTQIILDMDELQSANNKFRDLIMHPMQKSRNKREDNDFTNLLKLEMFSIFKNVNTLIIKDYYGAWSVSMIGLLSLIEFGSLDKVVVKDNKHNKWISSLWSSDSKILKHKYR